MGIFHKTEIQTVILKCLMSLNLNWYKSYDTKRKNSKNANLCFWTTLQKNGNRNISFLCHNLWTNHNLFEFRPVKHVIMTVWTSVLWKMNIHISKKWPELVITLSFIKEHSFRISLYIEDCWFLLLFTTIFNHSFWKNRNQCCKLWMHRNRLRIVLLFVKLF